jgi:hypothetical protein
MLISNDIRCDVDGNDDINKGEYSPQWCLVTTYGGGEKSSLLAGYLVTYAVFIVIGRS